MIRILSEATIFNGQNEIIFHIDNPDILDIRKFLRDFRDAMNGLHQNSNRYFMGMYFEATPSMKLVGFYKTNEPGRNVLHTDENLSFNGDNILYFRALIRYYTVRDRLTIIDIDEYTAKIVDRDWNTGVAQGVLPVEFILPSFHNGRKITQIASHRQSNLTQIIFTQLHLTQLKIPVYIERVDGHTFNGIGYGTQRVNIHQMVYRTLNILV